LGEFSGGSSTLANDSATLALGRTAPHANLLAGAQRVFQTCDTHMAPITDLLGVFTIIFITWIKDGRIKPVAGSQLAPLDFFRGHA
jgi:hypothetical protein